MGILRQAQDEKAPVRTNEVVESRFQPAGGRAALTGVMVGRRATHLNWNAILSPFKAFGS